MHLFGKARFETHYCEVASLGEYIDSNSKLKVIKVEENKIIVESIKIIPQMNELALVLLQASGPSLGVLIGSIIASLVLLIVFLYFVPVNLWITAIFSGVKVGLFELVFMRIRKVPPRIVVDSLITATKAGLKVTTSELETHYLASGNVPNVIRALISAEKANIKLEFNQSYSN